MSGALAGDKTVIMFKRGQAGVLDTIAAHRVLIEATTAAVSLLAQRVRKIWKTHNTILTLSSIILGNRIANFS